MLIISLAFAIAGPFAEIVYFKDWWNPITIFGSFISLEPIIIGFAIGGIASIIAEEILGEKHKNIKKSKNTFKKKDLNIFLLLFSLAVIFFGSFFLLKLNSLITTIFSFGIPTTLIYLKRRDLIFNSIISGILLILIAINVYTFVEFITPGWIDAFWQFNNTSKIIIFNLPINDFLWYFLCGAFIGPLYEYWREAKLIRIKKRN
ncbi:hypothetical protein HYW75_03010 [Candidatus Pacearchaeota archaeon]|nr:hypothetical protein [Candidatus Pacearchaeota archaeon]